GSHPALIQDFETRSHRAPVETQLRVHFHPHYGGMGDENFSARLGTDYEQPSILSLPTDRSHSLLAGGRHFYRDLCQRDRHYHLREQEILRRNYRVRGASVALADLKAVES